MRSAIRLASAAIASVVACSSAHAAYIASIEQVGSNVVMTGSGSLNLDSSTPVGAGDDQGLVYGPLGVDLGPAVFAPTTNYHMTGFAGPSSIGSGDRILANSGSGLQVELLFAFSDIDVSPDYVSGTPTLVSTDTFNNTTIAALGLTEGFYEWTWGSGPTADFFSLQIGPAVSSGVPEPESLALLGLGVVAIGLARRKRTR